MTLITFIFLTAAAGFVVFAVVGIVYVLTTDRFTLVAWLIVLIFICGATAGLTVEHAKLEIKQINQEVQK